MTSECTKETVYTKTYYTHTDMYTCTQTYSYAHTFRYEYTYTQRQSLALCNLVCPACFQVAYKGDHDQLAKWMIFWLMFIISICAFGFMTFFPSVAVVVWDITLSV